MQRLSIASLIAVGIFIGWACGDAVPNMFPDAGADAGADADTGSKSGSRIEVRPVISTGDDGSVLRRGEEYFDTDLNTQCWPALVSDGTERCIPTVGNWTYANTTFADSECTTPVRAWLDPCEPPASFLVTGGEAVCGKTSYLVFRMNSYDGPVYTSEGGGCAPFDNPSWNGLPLATIGAELLPSEMVALTR